MALPSVPLNRIFLCYLYGRPRRSWITTYKGCEVQCSDFEMSAEPGMHWLRLSETSDSSSPRFSRGRLFAGVLTSCAPRLTSSSCAFILSRVLRLTPAPASYVSLLRFLFLQSCSILLFSLADPRRFFSGTLLPWRIRAKLFYLGESAPIFPILFSVLFLTWRPYSSMSDAPKNG